MAIATRFRISDPKPAYCAACFKGATEDVVFVDFDAALDRGAIVDGDTMAVLETMDDLHLCSQCIRDAAELLSFKPELQARQEHELDMTVRELNGLRDYVADLEKALVDKPKRTGPPR
jgi:hypothetical protein